MNPLLPYQRTGFLALAVCLCAVALGGIAVSEAWQVYTLVVLVILAGLPHGALDPLVARKANLWKSPAGFAAFITAYLALAFLALLGWLAFPRLSLLAFLLYSGFHFSGDWRKDLSLPLRLASGLFVVSAPALTHPAQTATYFGLLTNESIGLEVLFAMQLVAIPATAGLVVAAIRARQIPAVRMELLVLMFAAVLLEPLLFFILYFCALHSPRHLIHAAEGLPVKAAVLTALTFTLLSVLLGMVAVVMNTTAPLAHELIQILFIGLAVLTVPHMLLVEWAESPESPLHWRRWSNAHFKNRPGLIRR